jgi:hypothetical protein
MLCRNTSQENPILRFFYPHMKQTLFFYKHALGVNKLCGKEHSSPDCFEKYWLFVLFANIIPNKCHQTINLPTRK